VIQLDAVSKRWGETVVVAALDLQVARGELLVLLGESGSGKTTTLKMINRLVEPTAGRILVDGADVRGTPPHELRRRIGYVFQRIGLFPHLTVAENVGITPQLLGWPRQRVERRVAELLQLVELDQGLALRFPGQLSGGEQQRVGVARALAAAPAVMLLDEPFGSLDPLTRDSLQQSFQRIRRQTELTAIFVTHDMLEALLLGDRIAVLRSGRLEQVGTPTELLRRPASEYVRHLLDTPRRQAEQVEALLGGAAS